MISTSWLNFDHSSFQSLVYENLRVHGVAQSLHQQPKECFLLLLSDLTLLLTSFYIVKRNVDAAANGGMASQPSYRVSFGGFFT